MKGFIIFRKIDFLVLPKNRALHSETSEHRNELGQKMLLRLHGSTELAQIKRDVISARLKTYTNYLFKHSYVFDFFHFRFQSYHFRFQ